MLNQQNPAGLALPHTAKVVDVVQLSSPSQVKLDGLLGERYRASQHARLPVVDEEELLAGFRHHPGKQAWIGEHVGKWLHAASLTYMSDNDPALRAKMDRVAHALMATQEADGYMGTYPVGKRFCLASDSEWDVWVHKYCMIGLLSYYQATQDKEALQSVIRIGDLLVKTFAPGGQLFTKAGTHMGMASTSVLEPTVLLYRATGDTRYLDFARRIVEAYNEPEGSHIETDLLATHSVAKTANGKAYEMLSNLVGLAELYRATGEKRYLKPVQIAWDDIVKNRLYPTGTGSSLELWTKDGEMPFGESDNVGETCVTVTWIQLNLELLRLTGDPKYVDQVERSTYNHLLAAQRPDGAAWCYYSPLEGRRHPSSETTCCLSSGPRGIALLPTLAYASHQDGLDINLYGTSSYSGAMDIKQTSGYPFSEDVKIEVDRPVDTSFTLRLRIPSWASEATVSVNGVPVEGVVAGEYLSVRRTWTKGDRLDIRFPMSIRAVQGVGTNSGSRAFASGPLVFAADTSVNPEATGKSRFGSESGTPRRTSGDRLELDGFIEADGFLKSGGYPALPHKIVLVPFYQAGANEARYSVWIRSKQSPPLEESVFASSKESVSRVGNELGSFTDGDLATATNTYTNSRADEDWFAATVEEPVEIGRIVFHHGRNYHDGGWFDTSGGKPVVQVLRTKGGSWETVGRLESYPATDAVKLPDIRNGQAFEARFHPIKVLGIRVVGKPSQGERPTQNFTSCAELDAFKN